MEPKAPVALAASGLLSIGLALAGASGPMFEVGDRDRLIGAAWRTAR